jgi:predicted AAA+ superfamily ATPase
MKIVKRDSYLQKLIDRDGNGLVNEVYLSDIAERHNVRNRVELDELTDILASGIGATPPSR